MKYLLFLFIIAFTSCSQTFYIVRHGEKQAPTASMSRTEASDPPLSEAGLNRALALKDVLKKKKIRAVFSTNYKRTINTVKPVSEAEAVPIQLYAASMDSMNLFIDRLKSIRKGNVLIAGHSNTVDDLANKLTGKKVVPGDLPETEYNNLFIIKRKGNRYVFSRTVYGK